MLPQATAYRVSFTPWANMILQSAASGNAIQYGMIEREQLASAGRLPRRPKDATMSQEPEQIDDLTYLPNPAYPYPFPVVPPPHYWMTEQTGRLAQAVECYFTGEPLASADLSVIKQYLRQYLERAVMTGDAKRAILLTRAAALRTTREIERFADDLAEIGVEPF